MGNIKFYSPTDFDDPSSGVTIAGYVKVSGAYFDSSDLAGTAGQVLSSTVTGTQWVDQSTIAASSAESVEVPVKNVHTALITKGTPVYIFGSVGSSGVLEIKPADASVSGSMPALGLLKQDLAPNAEGLCVTAGKLRNLITSPIDGATPVEGDVVYVKPGGGLTTTKPQGSSNLIQNMGKVGVVSTSNNGTFVVSSILRSNDVPNLTTGKIWVGTATNTTESTTVHLDEINARLGIGTTAPSSPLNIRSTGNRQIHLSDTSDSTSQGLFLGYDSAGNVLSYIGSSYNSDVSRIDFRMKGLAEGDSKMSILGSGNVGIGTTSPSSKLHIKQSADSIDGGLTWESVDGTQEWSIDANNAGNFRIYKGTTAIARFDSSGNLGIGTTSPAYKLDVSGTARISNDIALGAFNEITGVANDNLVISVDKDNLSGSSSIDFQLDGATSALFINNSRYVGIGTTSPSAKLDVNGQIRASSGLEISGGNINLVDNSRIRFGAAADLQIYHDALNSYITDTGTGDLYIRGSNSIYIGNNAGTKTYISGTDGGATKLYYDGAGAQQKLETTSTGVSVTGEGIFTGNVGIGTSSPSQKLDVVGSIRSSAEFQVFSGTTDIGQISNLSGALNIQGTSTRDVSLGSDTNPQALFVEGTNGNVGIGTTSPSTNLEVASLDATGTKAIIRLTSKDLSVIDEQELSEIQFFNSDADGSHVSAYIKNIAAETYGRKGQLALGTSQTNATNAVEAMRIDENGNVGIGETSPDFKLETTVAESAPSDFITPFSIKRSYATSSATDMYTGMVWRDVNTIQAGIYANRTNSASNYESDLNFYTNAGSSSMTPATALSTAKMTILAGGNVGIGTTSPSKKLTVRTSTTSDGVYLETSQLVTYGKIYNSNSESFPVGNLNLAYGTNDTAAIQALSNRMSLKGGYTTGGQISFLSASTEIMRMTSIGLGIGTTSPSQKLHVDGNFLLENNSEIRQKDSGGTQRTIIELDSSNDLNIGGSYSGALKFIGGGSYTEVMRIHDNGNVGIGTTSPTTPLHVRADAPTIRLEDITSADNHYLVGNNGEFRVQSSGFITMRPGAAVSTTFLANGNVGIGTTSPSQALEVNGIIQISNTYKQYLLQSNNTYGNLLLQQLGAATIPLTVNSANLGIGVGNISLQSALNVNGGIAAGSYYNTAAPVNGMIISGNVGIGTTSPSYKLDVAGDIRVDSTSAAQIFLDSAASNDSVLNFYENSSQKGKIGYDTSLSGIAFVAGSGAFSSADMVVLDSGNVGIGTTSPGSILHIESSSPKIQLTDTSTNASSYIDADSGFGSISIMADHGNTSASSQINLMVDGSSKMVVKDTGNVGIGTTSPAEKLHVAGDLKVEGDLHLEGDIGFRVINSGGFGQPEIELPNFADVFYRADRRFTVTTTGGTTNVSGLFGGNFSSLTSFAANTTHTITINVSNQSGVPTNGFTYPQGYIYISFYSTTNNYDSISGRVKDKDNVYRNMSGLTDIIPNGGNYKVMRLTVPSNNYAVEYEITLVTGTDLVRLAAINYLSSRHTSQMELPYLNKTLDTNRLFGNVDVLTNSSVAQNRLSGTGNSYLNANTGNVGIGNSTPGEKLTVSGNIRLNNNGNQLRDYNSNRIIGNASNVISIGSGATTSVNVPTGNVGIGTTSPSQKLDVAGNISLRHTTEDAIKFGGAGDLYGTSSANSVKLQKPGRSQYFLFGTQTGYFQVSDGTNNILLRAESTPEVNIYNTGALNYTQHSATNNNNGNVLTWSNSTSGNGERGRVSIVGDLRLDDYSSGSAVNVVNIENNGDAYFSGNVGIGIASPSEKLSIATSTNASAEIGYAHVGYIGHNTYAGFSHVNQNTTLNYAFLQGSNGETYINAPTGQNVNFRINNSTHMILNNSGNIGIGTTNPVAPLDVNGNIQITGVGSTLIFDNSSVKWQQYVNGNEFTLRYNGGVWSERLRIDTDGNLGIGTTNPTEKLDVNGIVKSTGLHVTSAPRIDAGGGTQPGAIPFQSPSDAIVRSGGDTAIYLSEPDEWLVVNISGVDYVIPAYL